MSSDFWNGEFVAALLDVHDKQTGDGPYPSTTLFNADMSNGCDVPDDESQVSVVGSVNMGVNGAGVVVV